MPLALADTAGLMTTSSQPQLPNTSRSRSPSLAARYLVGTTSTPRSARADRYPLFKFASTASGGFQRRMPAREKLRSHSAY